MSRDIFDIQIYICLAHYCVLCISLVRICQEKRTLNTGNFAFICCCQQTMSLTEKCAVVYSGARGIGRAYCEHLLQNGCKVSII